MDIVYTKTIPQSIGPYSQAVISGNYVFLSGQIGINPISGNIEENIENQTNQIFINIGEILKQCGLDYKNIIKSTIFLKNINDFGLVNKIYESFLSHKPARSTVEVSNLPKNAKIEIEVIAELQKI